MRRIKVELGESSYEVAIGSGLIGEAGAHLARFCPHGRAFVVTDAHVAGHWLAPLAASLERTGIAIEPVILPPGETTKSWRHLEDLVEALLAFDIGRDETVIALGGGMVGDIAGLVASIVKRGCGLVQIPTSLLAQVDSAVGGKTAINGRSGRNLVGAFHQPLLVLVDPATLATLPERELRAGYAETLKYGLIGDTDFHAWCERHAGALLARDEARLAEAIAHCLAAKAAIVAADETERSGRRALLNLGHTFAHAIESEAPPGSAPLHGEAVAIGIALAFGFSARLGLCDEGDARRVAGHLESVGLPAALPPESDPSALVARMRRDKKASGGALALILVRGIGDAFLAPDVDAGEVEDFLRAQLSGIGRE